MVGLQNRSYLGPTCPKLAPSIPHRMNMFLQIIVSVMAIALAVEVFALAGMAVTALRAGRRAKLVKDELSNTLRPSIRLLKDSAQSLRPDLATIRRNSAEIAATVRARYHPVHELLQDASRRVQRLRLRLGREGVATVGRLQHDRRFISQGVLKPFRRVATVALGVRATTWLLRKVA